MWKLLRRVLLDKRILSVGSLLLLLVFIDSRLPCGLNPITDELDTLEHFLFGFVLSDLSSKTVNMTRLSGLLNKKLRQKESRRTDLIIRLLGFLFIGGLLWELSELFIFPMFGSKPSPFFSFPITLLNIDGTIDVTVGILGCLIAWYLACGRGCHSSNK